MTGGPLDMPADGAAVVGIEELCIHGWDLARAIGQPFEATDAELDVIDHFNGMFADNLRGGGYGYMSEYPIARAYTDARVTRIYGGTNEIMKEIIGRSLGL